MFVLSRWPVSGLVLLALVVTSIGCGGTKNIPLPSDYYSKERRVAVVVIQPPRAGYYKGGDQGLLDMAISEAATDKLQTRLLELEADNVLLFMAHEWLEPGLDANDVDASVGNSAVAASTLPTFDGGDNKTYGHFDVRPIAQATGADEVLVISLLGWGLTRNYYGFIAMGPPEPTARYLGVLIDGDDNRVLWRYHTVRASDVKGEWKQPTRYTNATRSIGTNLAHAFNELLLDLRLERGAVEAKEIAELMDAPGGSYVAAAPAATKNHEADAAAEPVQDQDGPAEGKQHDPADAAAGPTESKEPAAPLADTPRGQAIELFLTRCEVGNRESNRSLAEAQYDQLINVLGYDEADILPLAEKLSEGCDYVSFKTAITSMARD